MDCDLALINGQVIDPIRGEVYGADVAVKDGKIAAVSRERQPFDAARTIDVSGAYLTPALIDCHVHCFEHVSPGSLNPDRIGVRQGVGVVLDAGSFGPRNAAGFYEYVVRAASTRVFGLVNISRWGNSTNPGESEVVGFLNPTEVVRVVERSGGWVRGVKVRASASAVGALGILPVHLAKQAAREAGVPLMVHIGNGPPTLEEVCGVLTDGDVVTHCFHGKVGGSVTRRGDVLPAIADAVARGVLLDVGHGSGSFAWKTAERALGLGLAPHSISTDLHRGCVDGPAYSLVATMSKLLHLGMPLVDVVRAATATPARTFGLDQEFGRIDEGSPANLSTITIVDRAQDLFDVERQSRRVERQIEALYTILGGTVYDADLA
ncbi:MAG TPA: amidohydrolase/deacetylase family metallohydrolase [Chloroflexota bacterium]|nr:amidohydrolase/deacetylase family metallohydrolase [Chloroflexota bacterium]